MKAAFKDLYPKSNLSFFDSLRTSSEVSSFMLETYNDHSHNTRYGAFAIRDEVNLTVNIDWDDLASSLDNLQNLDVDGNGSVALSETLGVSGPMRWNITSATLIDVLQALTPLTNETLFNVTHFLSQTDAALTNVMESAVNHSGIAGNLNEAFTDFESNVQGANNDTVNASLFGAVLELLDDVAYAAVEAGQATDNSTNVTNIFDALRLTSESLNRGVMREILVDVLEAFENSVINANVTINETAVADAIIRASDIFAGGGENSTNGTASHTNAIIVAGLALVDGVLDEATKATNGTLSIGEVVDLFSDSAGGLLYFEASEVLLDLDDLTIAIRNLTITFQGEVIVDNETITIDLDDAGSIIGELLPSGSQEFVYTLEPTASVLHNTSSPHAAAAFHQTYNEFLFKTCSQNDDARLVSVNHPLPLTTQQEIEVQTVLSILASLFLLIPYCYIPAAFAVFLVKERVSKSKHLQLVSGVNLSAYWLSSYLWDLGLWLALSVLIMLIFLMYGTSSAAVFVGDVESFFCTFLLTFGYGLSALPFAYLLSRMFNNHSSAQIAIMGIFFITGFVAVNAYFIMSSIESTQDIAEGMRPGLRTLPAYNVGEGFIQLSSAYWEREILGSEKYPFDWDVCGRNLCLIYALSVPYFLWLIMLEYSSDGGAGGAFGRWLRKLRDGYDSARLRWSGVRREGGALNLEDGLDQANTHEDDDVIAERVRVEADQESLQKTASVLLVNLWKVYPPSVGMFGACMSSIAGCLRWLCCCLCFRKNNDASDDEDDDERMSTLPKRAVRGVSTAVMPGETYGLLGVNGAGKTTTLGVLTGDVKPTTGVASIGGFDVTGNTPGGVEAARQQLGYCPQIDPLLDLMTGRETLRMFGKLRGIPGDKLESTVQALLDQLTLTPHADKVSESYSGGNKRKLSLGIALIGDPKVLLIDEASSGMDPAARRHTWELIEAVRKQRSVILTTHLMEEAEALCTRVGVMVKGQLLCLGTVQYLKTKYLDGYTIDIQCESGATESEIDEVVSKVATNALPGSEISERHGRFLRFDMPSLSSLGLGETFRRLQQLREESSVDNYSISQCSLEQVFIKLVKGDGGSNLQRPSSADGGESTAAASTDVSEFDVEANK
uniref:ABC transporter domain-containing protein n=1 Tax=Grammatophora oceanica TaxID=210454 RepID=A0A7S1VG15_9STRA